MRSRFIVALFALSLFGCAAVFRDTSPRIEIDSDPRGAHAITDGAEIGLTPTAANVPRAGTTQVTYKKDGYVDTNTLVKKRVNPAWLTLDILDCIFPITLCLPIIIDAVSGAWYDVEKVHVGLLEPLPTTAVGAAPAPPPTGAVPVVPPTPTAPSPQMTESERKAAARAAFLEGAALQDKNDCTNALGRFEIAEKLYDAPTHVLHIAECDAQLGKLVEAQEGYETLAHTMLPATAPDAFKQAQETAKRELPALQQRIPTLRINLTPPPSSLQGLTVKLNGKAVPVELVGIARPVNPGAYKVTVSANGYKPGSADVALKEGDAKTADVKLTH